MAAAEAKSPFRRVAVVGLGLIGGSIAARLRRSAPDVRLTGIDHPTVLDRALALGLIDERRAVLADVDVDLVVLATPVDATPDLLAAAGAAGTTALITDTCSTKRHVMAAASAAHVARFIGGHPIAGSEHAGLEHADADLFRNRAWLLVARDAGAADARALAAFVTLLGAVPAFVDADLHDRTMAYVSHVPQLLAVALMNAAGESCGEAGLASAGRAFREMTRLAASPGDLWQGILRTNEDNVAEALAAVVAQLPSSAALHDADRLRADFDRARYWRARVAPAGQVS
jgi:prephenate dehydrogenase